MASVNRFLGRKATGWLLWGVILGALMVWILQAGGQTPYVPSSAGAPLTSGVVRDRGGEANDKEASLPIGAGFEVLNSALALGTIATGPLLLYRSTRRRWSRPIHLALGAGYIVLFALALVLTGFAELAAGGFEWVNLLLIGASAVTAALMLWKPQQLRRRFGVLMSTHVIVGTMFAVKFLAEPLLGGKLW